MYDAGYLSARVLILAAEVCCRCYEFAFIARHSDESAQEDVNAQAARILDSYGNSVLRLAYSYLHNMPDAEDILQETLIRYFRSAPHFESDSHKKAWLLRVAANLSKNRINYNKVRFPGLTREMG